MVRELLAAFRAEPLSDLPPFQGEQPDISGTTTAPGSSGCRGRGPDDLAIPDVVLGLYDWVISWDHRAGHAWLLATGAPERDPRTRARRARERVDTIGRSAPPAAETRRAARHVVVTRQHARGVDAWTPPRIFPCTGLARSLVLFFARGYLRAVARVREYIVAGDIFQANLSQRFEAPWAGDPCSLYRRLRRINPAPFAAYFETPEFAVVSASPERFIRVDAAGAVETRPIKGTTPRGVSPEHDAHLGRALAESEKDRAENLMIVDLLRNDFRGSCRAGSVRVPELFALEHYSTVHHLVSTVVGELANPAPTPSTCCAQSFPGGSITGAPKVRAMEIIAELEPSRRGVYCGALGYLSGTGAADTSIVIRTYLVRDGRAYFSAGGGLWPTPTRTPNIARRWTKRGR